MILRATVRGKHGNDFVRTIDVHSAKDFDKVGTAAGSWAKRMAKGMQLYGPSTRRELSLHLEWVEPAPANGAPAKRLYAQESLELDARSGAVLSRKMLAGKKRGSKKRGRQ
jgi:hypothetical protein